MDNPETPRHPVIGAALRKLSVHHTVRLLDVRGLTNVQSLEQEQLNPQADLYLLKSHAPQALDLASQLEARGAQVINSWASSVACQDRVLMTQRMTRAGLPWPDSFAFSSLQELLSQHDLLVDFAFPLIIKSHYSHRGDLVSKIDTLEELQALAPQWASEPIVLQKFAENDGWDIKLWVIDQHIFAARRRAFLEPGTSKEDVVIPSEELPQEWGEIVHEIGRIFDLQLFGVDLLMSDDGPIIVDVNSFPGFRGVPGADDALVALVERLNQERGVNP